MFKLEPAIAEWRRQMQAAGIQTPAPLEELESHLREEIERQPNTGLKPKDAFAVAVQKLGTAPTVQREFQKNDQTPGGFNWKVMDFSLMTVTILIPLILGGLVLKRGSLADLTAAQELSCLAALAAFSLFAWTGRLSLASFPVIARRRMGHAIGVSGSLLVALWWIIFVRLIVPHYDFTVGQFLVAFTWAWLPAGGVGLGLVWGVTAAARKNLAGADRSASQG